MSITWRDALVVVTAIAAGLVMWFLVMPYGPVAQWILGLLVVMVVGWFLSRED